MYARRAVKNGDWRKQWPNRGIHDFERIHDALGNRQRKPWHLSEICRGAAQIFRSYPAYDRIEPAFIYRSRWCRGRGWPFHAAATVGGQDDRADDRNRADDV